MSANANSTDHGCQAGTTGAGSGLGAGPGAVVELNVGGVMYATSLDTLARQPDSLLASLFAEPATKARLLRDSKGKVFIDRDGVLFRYVLDYLRDLRLVLPENFHERERLKQEAEYYRLPDLVKSLSLGSRMSLQHLGSSAQGSSLFTQLSSGGGSCPTFAPVTGKLPGYITLGYRGTFAFGRDGLADVKFRKLSRIIVCGKVSLCREVFKDSLNESRDPDRGENDRYTGRFFLKHTFLEQAFDCLQDEGFSLVGSCGSGTNSAGEVKPGLDTEEAKWQHYNEFIFERR